MRKILIWSSPITLALVTLVLLAMDIDPTVNVDFLTTAYYWGIPAVLITIVVMITVIVNVEEEE